MNFWKSINRIAACLALGSLMASCSLVEDDLPECGLDLYFRYDYNLERANMFPDHVGGLRAYIYDENGKFLTSQTQARTAAANPFKQDGYHMHFSLPKGKYRVVAVAFQKDYSKALATTGAKFRYTEPAVGDDITNLRFDLDHSATADADGRFAVDATAPLDTLWIGMSGNELTANTYHAVPQAQLIEVKGDKGSSRDTISLVRDTKQINVTLRDLAQPAEMDVDNYDFRIVDRNPSLLWNNVVEENAQLLYTPYNTWNTEDRTVSTSSTAAVSPLADAAAGIGRIAHADFMTSRILYHDNAEDDAILSVTNRTTGAEVIRVDLADLLSRLRTSADIYRYTPQQFLDRGYDYRLSFFLQGDRWMYVNIEISVLSWSKRIQREQL